jgi:large subunit ribosomal protein L25
MEKVVLHATRRSVTGKQVGQLRRAGQLPAVIYGHNFSATPIVLDLHSTSLLLAGITSTSIVYIELDGKENATLVREKQRDFIRGTFLHLDFQVVSLTEKIRAKVSVVLAGVSPAVKDYNGVVVVGLDEVEVEALPQYLPERISLDISSLAKIGDSMHVRDLRLDQNVEILDDADEMLVIVKGTTEEVEVTEGSEAEPEVIEKGKKEEEEA